MGGISNNARNDASPVNYLIKAPWVILKTLLYSLRTFFNAKFLMDDAMLLSYPESIKQPDLEIEENMFSGLKELCFGLFCFIIVCIVVAVLLYFFEGLNLSFSKNLMALFGYSFLLHAVQIFMLEILKANPSEENKDFTFVSLFILCLFERAFDILLFIAVFLMIMDLPVAKNYLPTGKNALKLVWVFGSIFTLFAYFFFSVLGVSHLTVIFTVPIITYWPENYKELFKKWGKPNQ